MTKTGPAGPPGYNEAPGPLGVTGVTTNPLTSVAAPAPEPDPDTVHSATATPTVIASVTAAPAALIHSRFFLMSNLLGIRFVRSDGLGVCPCPRCWLTADDVPSPWAKTASEVTKRQNLPGEEPRETFEHCGENDLSQ